MESKCKCKTRDERKPGSQMRERDEGAARMSTTHHQIVSLSLIIFAVLACHSLTPVHCSEDKEILTILAALGRSDHLALSSEVDTVKTSTAGTNTTMSSINSKLGNITELITENRDRIATLQTNVEGMGRIVTAVQEQIDLLSSEVEKGNLSLSEQRQYMISLETIVLNVSEAILENRKSIEALISGLHTILLNVSSNQNDILALSKRISVITATTTTTTTTPQPSTPIRRHLPLHLNCGGRIPMYAKGGSVSITYKEYQRYNNNERCLWTLDNEANHTRSKQAIAIILVRHGFAEPADWLYALTFNRDKGLDSQKIEYGREYAFSEDQLYLIFTSDHSVTGFGFSLQLTVINSVEIGHGWVQYSSSSSGVAEGGAYVDDDLFNIVINPKTSFTFQVNFVRIEYQRSCDYDRLLVWEIGQVGNFRQKARLCGDISTTSASFTTSNPVIVLFTADGSKTGPPNAGFKVSWR